MNLRVPPDENSYRSHSDIALLAEQQSLLELIAKGRPLEACLDALAAAAMRLSSTISMASFAAGDGAGTGVDGAGCSTPVFDSEGAAIGAFVLQFREPHVQDGWERKIAEFGARIAGIAIERERTMRALHDSRAQLETDLSDTKLLQAISTMIREDDVNALFEKFMDAAIAIMASDCASIQMFYPERGTRGELLLLASRGLSPEAQEYWKWVGVEAGSTCAQSLRTRKRTIVTNYAACGFAERRNDRAAFLAAGLLAAQSTPLFSRNGDLLGMISTHWNRPHQPSERDLRLFDILARQAADLIERRLAERALRESEKRLRAFVATSSDAVYIINSDFSEIRYLDGDKLVANTTVSGRDWMDTCIHADDQARVLARINEAIAAKATFDAEHRVIRADGTLGWTHSRAIPLLDETGEIAEWFGAATDVTLKKQMESQQKRALRESQRVVETLQAAFLPQMLPQLEHVRFDAAYLPAGEGALVGGDWYDAAQMPDGRVMLCVGDVTGHGLSAAVTAGKLRQAATVAALTVSDPAEVLNVLNRVLRFQHPEVYATAVLAFLNAEGTELTYASAGHPQAFVATANAGPVAELRCGGLPLGVADDLELSTHRLSLPDEFAAAFYTDGLTEFRRNIAGAEDAMKRHLKFLVNTAGEPLSAKTMVDAVLGNARPPDDVVLLLVQRGVQVTSGGDEGVHTRETFRFHSNDGAAARRAREALAALASGLNLGAQTAFAAQTVLGEALANTVQHAPGLVEVAFESTDENLMLTVRDQGPGIGDRSGRLPRELLDESGRGLFLMRALAAQVMVEPGPDGGTEVRASVPLKTQD